MASDKMEPKDARGYFMLPQAPEDSGYYAYGKIDGKPSHGAFQYASPAMMSVIIRVAREWQAIDHRRFGVGDISLAGGLANNEHKSHMSGFEVDVRPLRKDGCRAAVTWSHPQYDREGTAKLIELFRTHAQVALIYFNGPGIPYVSKRINHDNHFHVKLRA